MIFILLIYAYDNSSSQTCSLKYQLRALENDNCGVSDPTVLLATQSAADHSSWWQGLRAFDRATNRHQHTRIVVAIDQNATAIPWLVAQDLTSVLVVSGCRFSTNR